MADLLSHALVGFGIFTIASWFVSWIDVRWITVGMVGAILPDLNRVGVFVPEGLITDLIGLPFDTGAVHSIGGIVLLAGIGALFFGGRVHQRRAFLLLLAGAITHLLVDLPQRYADGLMLTNRYLFPVTTHRFPTPGWYISADRWVLGVAVAFAVVVYLIDRYIIGSTDTQTSLLSV